MRPRSKGSGIMISDFIDERNGFLALTKEEYDRAVVDDPSTYVCKTISGIWRIS